MRKYTSKSQKVEMYSKKYNKPREEVFRILTEHEALLSLDELKIKYDNPNIGKLPQWLVDEGGYDALAKYIENGIRKKYDIKYSTWVSKEDLTSYMWEFILKRIHLYETPAHIVSSVANRMVWLWRQNKARGDNFAMSLQDSISKSDDNDGTYSDIITKPLASEESGKTRMNVMSERREDVRDILVAASYLISNIPGFEHDFQKIVAKCKDEQIKNDLKELESRVEEGEEITRMKMDGIPVTKRKPKVTIKDIIKAMKFNVETVTTTKLNKETNEMETVTQEVTYSVTNSLNELRDYLKFTGFVNN